MMVKLNEVRHGSPIAPLADGVAQSIQRYFAELKGDEPVSLYQLVMDEIELPLLKCVMEHCKHNQSRAATMLGMSRGTLRAKLKKYFDKS